MIKKVLVANRGEIAVRIIRAAHEEDIEAVAVYSEADARAVHVRMADEGVCIGPAPASQSYLDADKIIEAAKRTGCQAIHPGYGFLAENAPFAQKIQDAGLIFIGPDARAIASMGDKLQARRIMTDAGVPVVPGVLAETESSSAAHAAADKLGYPILVKAAGGGGGKGMRLVNHPDDLDAALEGAAREARAAFGDARVYLEKFLVKPRHIEIQVLADKSGNTVHLFERECSIQRRHQKVIEETPSPVIDERLRMEMGEAAVRAARAVKYHSAGTVEFMVDQDRNFYFLEMNTRIQVEHPVTELITGVDLVRQQFRIASDQDIPFAQSDIRARGHALECRIYAENPDADFLPSPGKLHLVRHPVGPGIRVDSGIDTGVEITVHYDPILAKIITWGENREVSRLRMIRALEQTVVLGVHTPISFLIRVLKHPEYISGALHTGFLAEHGFLGGNREPLEIPDEVLAVAGVASAGRTSTQPEGKTVLTTPWTEIGPMHSGI